MPTTVPRSVSRPSRDHNDAIIVGSGMAGHALLPLKDAGIAVLLIERGGIVCREPQNWDACSLVFGRASPLSIGMDQHGQPWHLLLRGR